MRSSGLIFYAALAGIIVLAAIFIPMIFGSMESGIDLTNNTTSAQYNTTATIIQGSELVLYGGAVLLVVFAIAGGLLIFTGGRRR